MLKYEFQDMLEDLALKGVDFFDELSEGDKEDLVWKYWKNLSSVSQNEIFVNLDRDIIHYLNPYLYEGNHEAGKEGLSDLREKLYRHIRSSEYFIDHVNFRLLSIHRDLHQANSRGADHE